MADKEQQPAENAPDLSSTNPSGGFPPPTAEDTTTHAPAPGENTPPMPGESAAPPQPSLSELLAANDIDASQFGGTDQEILDNITALNAQRQEIQRYAQVIPKAQEYLMNQSAYEQWQAQQQSQQQPHPTPQQTTQPTHDPETPWSWEAPPAYKDEWEAFCERDPNTGAYRLSPDAIGTVDPTIPSKVTEYKEWQFRNMRGMLHHFPEVVQQITRQQVENAIKEQIPQLIHEHTQAQVAEQQLGKFFDEHDDLWFQKDSSGNSIMDPVNQGQKLLSPVGQLVSRYAEQAEQQGILSQLDCLRYGMDQVRLNHADMLPKEKPTKKQAAPPEGNQPQPPANTQPPSPKENFLQKAIKDSEKADDPNMHVPNRDQTVRTSEQTGGAQNPYQDFGKMLDEDLANAGIQT